MASKSPVTDDTRIQRLFPHFYKRIIPDGLESMCLSLHAALRALEQSIQGEITGIANRTPLDGMQKVQNESSHHNLDTKSNKKTPKKRERRGRLEAKATSVAEKDDLQRIERLQKLENSLRICHEDVSLLQGLNAELSPVSNIPTLQDATIHAILVQSISGFADSIPLKSDSDTFPPELLSDINHMLQVTEAWIQTSEAALSFLTECKKATLKHITESNEIMQSIDEGICTICDQADGNMYVVTTASQSRQFAESVKADMLNLNKIWARELNQLKSEVGDLEDLLTVPDSSIKALEHDTEIVESRFGAAVMTQEVLERDEKPIGVLAAMLAKENTSEVLEDIYQGQLLGGSRECI